MPLKKQRKRAKRSFLVKYFGPSFLGTRSWLFISVLFLLGVALVGGFALIPLSTVVLGVIIGLKTGAFIAFLAGVGMGIKAVIDDYTEKAKDEKEYFWLPYLWDKLTQDFFEWLIKSPVNVVKFLLGFLLLAAVIAVLVCVCCPAVGIVIPGITAVVNFIGPAFEAVSLFGGSWILTAAFLGIGTMLAYGVFLRVLGGFFGSSKPRDNDCQTIKPNVEYKELDNVLDVKEKTGNDIYSGCVFNQEKRYGPKPSPIGDQPVTEDEANELVL